ncbi:unnamed protein product [Chrysoparadoxa australica]
MGNSETSSSLVRELEGEAMGDEKQHSGGRKGGSWRRLKLRYDMWNHLRLSRSACKSRSAASVSHRNTWSASPGSAGTAAGSKLTVETDAGQQRHSLPTASKTLVRFNISHRFSRRGRDDLLSVSDGRMIFGRGASPVEEEAQVYQRQMNSRVRPGEWALGECLARGSFGTVYQGLNAITGVLIAVKVLPLPKNDRKVMDLYGEVTLMQRLAHPNIVCYLGVELQEEEGRLCIFQEWAPGGSVASLLARFGPFKEDMIRRYTRQILEGLMYLHSNNVVHRDIKGSNILINDAGQVKLTDFGASQALNGLEKSLQGQGVQNERSPSKENERKSPLGTPYFMAPEVLMNQDSGFPIDIWSLGGVVVQMLSGMPPWSGIGVTTPSALLNAMMDNKGNLPPLQPGISDGLKSLLCECFEWEPTVRKRAAEIAAHRWLAVRDVYEQEQEQDKVQAKGSSSSQQSWTANQAPLSRYASSGSAAATDSCYERRKIRLETVNDAVFTSPVGDELTVESLRLAARRSHSTTKLLRKRLARDPPKPATGDSIRATRSSQNLGPHSWAEMSRSDVKSLVPPGSDKTVPPLVPEQWPEWAKTSGRRLAMHDSMVDKSGRSQSSRMWPRSSSLEMPREPLAAPEHNPFSCERCPTSENPYGSGHRQSFHLKAAPEKRGSIRHSQASSSTSSVTTFGSRRSTESFDTTMPNEHPCNGRQREWDEEHGHASGEGNGEELELQGGGKSETSTSALPRSPLATVPPRTSCTTPGAHGSKRLPPPHKDVMMTVGGIQVDPDDPPRERSRARVTFRAYDKKSASGSSTTYIVDGESGCAQVNSDGTASVSVAAPKAPYRTTSDPSDW